MPLTQTRFVPFETRMAEAGLPQVAIDTFRHYYGLLVEGQTGMIAESEIEPATGLPDAESFDAHLAAVGKGAMRQAVLMKLNGGLGTSMGLERAKSLLEVKAGLSFLDIIARQALGAGVPLVLMNSFNTDADSLEALERYGGLGRDLPLSFCQHKVPKVEREGLQPSSFPEQPELEWCPPGHGDLYTALVTSGMLDQLLAAGKRYAFVSNSDNLGATLDPALLGYMVEGGLPFMMEVADRTESDKKGGHLAQRASDGQLILRERAQCPAEDQATFQDTGRHRYFNTNNVWLDLEALQAQLEATGNVLGLPMIRNAKTVDPRDPTSTPVYQLETAMGSAIAVFEGAGAVRVPRSRFSPVKTTGDLLAIRSDAYVLTDDHRVVLDPSRQQAPVVDLDPDVYARIDDLQARFPNGAPSMLNCERLSVRGDVRFGASVTLQGDVEVVAREGEGPHEVPEGASVHGRLSV